MRFGEMLMLVSLVLVIGISLAIALALGFGVSAGQAIEQVLPLTLGAAAVSTFLVRIEREGA